MTSVFILKMLISIMVTVSVVVRHLAECSSAVAAAIAQLDANIMKIILNPKPEDAHKILADFKKYVSLVNITYDRLILNEISEGECVNIHMEGSLLIKINSTLLEKLYVTFDWQNEDVEGFKRLLATAEKLWLTFLTGCFYTFERFKDTAEIPTTSVYSM